MSSIKFFCHPAILQIFKNLYYDCKDLKIAQTAQINQLFRLLNLN